MIFDTLANKETYSAISPKIKKALDYLAQTDFNKMEPGRYDLDGSNIFALVQKYDSIPESQGKWEYHKNYIDIQFIASGTEKIGFQNINKMKPDVPYDSEKDIAFVSGTGDFVTLEKNSWAVFFPQDAHMPKVALNNKPEKVTKVVMKIKIG